jgi:hypothetical protein
LGILFLDCLVNTCHIAYYSISAFILFSVENSEAGKNVRNLIIRYRKIKNTQLGISDPFYVTKENTKGLPNDKPFVYVYSWKILFQFFAN